MITSCACLERKIFLLIVSLTLATALKAQNITNLYSFIPSRYNSSTTTYTNVGGANPYAGLIISQGVLYGTTRNSGIFGDGTVFKLNIDGTGFTNLHNFSWTDGANPQAGMVLSGSTLYGATFYGGSGYDGSIFKLSIDGAGFTNIYSFAYQAYDASLAVYTNLNGAEPLGSLTMADNVLYGTASKGGLSGEGVVFKINSDGSGFTVLHSFSYRDGIYPNGGLVFFGGSLYGATETGGSGGHGTIFSINSDGSDFTNMYSFSALVSGTNSDGANPLSGLLLTNSTLYGTTTMGGFGGAGGIFSMRTDGKAFTNIFSFSQTVTGTNGTGANPYAGLFLLGRTLYGTTDGGGAFGAGTIFAIQTDGTGATNICNFNPNVAGLNGNGSNPYAGLTSYGHTLYGTTESGGDGGGSGTIFEMILPIQPIPLNIQYSGANLILTWDDPAFYLQSAPFASGNYTNVLGASSPYTNSLTATLGFFRLQAN